MSESTRGERPPRTQAEWVTLAVAVVLVALVLGAIIAAWATGPDGPADLSATRDGPVVVDGTRWRVPFAVRNEGGQAADQVQVVAELTIDGTVEGEAEQVFSFVSSGDTERGEFFFTSDPALGTLTIDVVSYSEP